MYGIPEFYTIRAVLINNPVLDEAGLTTADLDTSNWDRLSAAAKKMYKETGGKPTTIGYDPKIPEFLPLWSMANGGSIVDAPGQADAERPEGGRGAEVRGGAGQRAGRLGELQVLPRHLGLLRRRQRVRQEDQIGAMAVRAVVRQRAGRIPATVSTCPRCRSRRKDGTADDLRSGSAFAIPKNSPNAGGMCEFMKLATSQGAWTAAAAARAGAL